MRLLGKVMIVSGAASGIGLATVEHALKEGAKVVMADLPTSEGGSIAENLNKRWPQNCVFVTADVSSTEEVNNLVAQSVAQFGRIDVVFNNAGIGGGRATAENYPDDEYLRIIDINLNGIFRLVRASLKPMYQQGSGSIINCASILGLSGQKMATAYSTAKGGVINLTRSLALEAAGYGVRVNSIAPGYIDTPLLAKLPFEDRSKLIALHPLGRLGKPEEIANAVIFLASDESSFITGANLVIDGGFMAGKS